LLLLFFSGCGGGRPGMLSCLRLTFICSEEQEEEKEKEEKRGNRKIGRDNMFVGFCGVEGVSMMTDTTTKYASSDKKSTREAQAKMYQS
jgi:hypothetical protein